MKRFERSTLAMLVGVMLVSLTAHAATPAVAAKQAPLPPSSPVAPAAPHVAQCEVVEFRGDKTGTPAIDAKLARFTKELGEISGSDTFTVTAGQVVTLEEDKSQSVKTNATFTLLFKGTSKQKNKDRLQLELTIDDAKGKRVIRTTFTEDSGASQIMSAGRLDKSKLYVAITCTLK